VPGPPDVAVPPRGRGRRRLAAFSLTLPLRRGKLRHYPSLVPNRGELRVQGPPDEWDNRGKGGTHRCYLARRRETTPTQRSGLATE
jgi:hypothetical protein